MVTKNSKTLEHKATVPVRVSACPSVWMSGWLAVCMSKSSILLEPD